MVCPTGLMVYLWTALGPEISHVYIYLASRQHDAMAELNLMILADSFRLLTLSHGTNPYPAISCALVSL